MENLSCAVIIPVYNEESVITETVDRLKQILSKVPNCTFEIICINDGSSDQTGKVLLSLQGITLLTHAVNRGYGAALRTGLDYCKKEWIFIVDADGTYPLQDFPNLITNIQQTKADMVVGARRGIGITMNPLKRIARYILKKMVHILTGVMVPDLNSGMRIFRKKLYQEFRHLLPLGFSFTTTLTVASLYSGYRISYLPIEYAERVGKSNIKPLKDFFGFLMLIIRLASYFDPLRFFLPLAALLFFTGFAKGLRDFILENAIGSVAAVLMIGGLQVFVTGIIADVTVRRSQSTPTEGK